MKFHDGTAFDSSAVKASFDRRLAVNQGPAYMVSDIASITTPSPTEVIITLKDSNSAFLDYLACAYSPKMMSPTALAANKGTDNDEKYLQTHDIGTGPYTLTKAAVGQGYEMKAFPGWWGPKAVLPDRRDAGHLRPDRRRRSSSTRVTSTRSCTTSTRRRSSPT